MKENAWDVSGRRREIARARDAVLSGKPCTAETPAVAGIRDVVAASWRRSMGAHVDPEQVPPVALSGGELEAHRGRHPLSEVIGLLRDLVGSVAQDGRHLMAVSDAAGRLLWVEGHATARRRAEAMNFVEGAVWDEQHAGTNAPGTALALGHAVQIFSAEHFRPTVQAWTCAAAPIHDPATGRILGVVDVTGGDIVAHPHSLALVAAAARACEAQLAVSGRSRGRLWLPEARQGAATGSGTRAARLLALGRDQAVLVRPDGSETQLGRRHSEVLVILSKHPEGLSGDRLAAALYEDDSAEATVRVEFTRLRRVLGADLVRSRPYRLTEPIDADFRTVGRALRAKEPHTALAAYTGPLLPRSEAPEVIDERHWIDAQLRAAVLESGDPALIEDWLRCFGIDDLDGWEHLMRCLPPGARRAQASAEAGRLRAETGPWRGATLR